MNCFLRFVDGSRVVVAQKEIILREADRTLACAEMLRALEELIQENGRPPEAWASWRMELTDTSGEVLFWINLAETNLVRSQEA